MAGRLGVENATILSMKMLITRTALSELKSKAPVPLECEHCGEVFRKAKNNVLTAIKGNPNFALRYCSLKCHYSNQIKNNWIEVPCAECEQAVRKQKSQIKDNNHCFCSRSCSTTYHNKHKMLGKSRKSKAETYLSDLIRADFRKLVVKENVRSILPSGLELDI